MYSIPLNIMFHAQYAEGKFKVSEYVLKEEHEMKTIEETMHIINLENNHRKTLLKRSKY